MLKRFARISALLGIVPGLLWQVDATAEIMFLEGVITGSVNGTQINFTVNIEMDFETGEETATISNIPAALGGSMRVATAMVTIAGPTGGMTEKGELNGFELTGGVFINSATMFWPASQDTVELIHDVTYDGGDTMTFTATMNGTMPVLSLGDEVTFSDFEELLIPGQGGQIVGAQSVTSGPGFRGDFSNAQTRAYEVGGVPWPDGVGKGSTMTYQGIPLPGRLRRQASSISTTYDPTTETMHVHLFNRLVPVGADPIFLDGFEDGDTRNWSDLVPFFEATARIQPPLLPSAADGEDPAAGTARIAPETEPSEAARGQREKRAP